MAFEFVGRQLRDAALLPQTDFSQTEIVFVTGGKFNPAGHVLLHVAGRSVGHYFHVPGFPHANDRPFYFSDRELSLYYSTSGKSEIDRKRVVIPKPEAARTELDRLMHTNWLYLLIPNNCVAFAEKVIHAGGNFWILPTNLPLLDKQFSNYYERVFGEKYCKLARWSSNLPQAIGSEQC